MCYNIVMRDIDLFPQLKNLYDFEEWENHQLRHHVSLYITPHGNIFNLRENGRLSHIDFSRKFYENYSKIKRELADKETFSGPLEELVEQGLTLKEVQDYYLDCFKNVAYRDMETFHKLRLHWLSSENLLVNDFGFVLISWDRGLVPEVVVPIYALGHNITATQKRIVIEVLKRIANETEQDYNSTLLLAHSQRKSNDFSSLLEDLNCDKTI